jgi:hypothetical protein
MRKNVRFAQVFPFEQEFSRRGKKCVPSRKKKKLKREFAQWLELVESDYGNRKWICLKQSTSVGKLSPSECCLFVTHRRHMVVIGDMSY